MPPETFTKEQAADLARGFPHLCRIVEGHPDDAPRSVEASARKAAFATDPIYWLDWPREVAGRFLRAFALGRPGSHASLGGQEAAAEIAKPGWPIAKDVPRLVRSIVFPPKGGAPEKGSRAWGRHSYPFEVAAVVYLLEAAFGADVVLDAAVATLEELAAFEKKLKGDRGQRPVNYAAHSLVVPTGMLLLRATAARSRGARARLEALVAGPGDAVRAVYALECLDFVLHGKAAHARSAMKWVPAAAWLFVEDDPAWVQHAIGTARGQVDPDVRGVWLGGEPVLALYLPHLRKVKRAALPTIVETFGVIRAPGTFEVMKLLAGKPGGEPAQAWLDAHGGEGGAKTKASAKAKKKSAKPARRPTARQIEAQYDALMDQLVGDLETVRGDRGKEEEALVRAARRFMEIRAGHDGEPTENLTHFFGADGVGHEKSRPTALARLEATSAEAKRWMSVLAAAG